VLKRESYKFFDKTISYKIKTNIMTKIQSQMPNNSQNKKKSTSLEVVAKHQRVLRFFKKVIFPRFI